MIGGDFDALLGAAQAGDETALVRLYRDLNPALVRFCGAQARGYGEDLAQEVWLATAKRLAAFVGDEKGFRAWVFTIARRRLIADWRVAGRRPERLSDPAELAEIAGGFEDVADASVLVDDAVQALVAGLPRAQAEIVLLRVVAGFDAEEVGSIVGRRAATVRVLQHRALRRLADRFAEEPVTK